MSNTIATLRVNQLILAYVLTSRQFFSHTPSLFSSRHISEFRRVWNTEHDIAELEDFNVAATASLLTGGVISARGFSF
jgi:hypothetical protein